MFKKIIEKLKCSSCKTDSTEDVNAFKESEKKKEDKTK
jgi:cytochrome c-type biogenesis protein CcmH/NrfF